MVTRPGCHLEDSEAGRILVRRSTGFLRCSVHPEISHVLMATTPPKELYILGITRQGKTFRPSDWAERLAGVMSQFRPSGAMRGGHLAYSPWCIPTTLDGVKCVVVNRDLRDHEPMAWDFVMNFAKDNDLQVVDGCLLP